MVGEAAFRSARDTDTTVGIDFAYISPESNATLRKRTSLIDGVPTLAVEILAPSDAQADITDKGETYLDAGVPVTMANITQHLDGGPHLPGFQAAVADIFVD
jgi:hypothetical protein